MKNGCPVCRNLNELTATQCRFCGTTLTPPVAPVQKVHRRRWPQLLGGGVFLILVLVIGGSFLFGGSGQPAQGAASAPIALEQGTDAGSELKFVPAQLEAPANKPVSITFANKAQLPHNMTFSAPIDAKTAQQVAGGASATLEFTTPAAGSYKYVCTLHPGMEGTLVVK
ncbi:MAG: hypothetical protein NVS2B7_26970 [Herpetosiphon sp.]